MALTADQIAAVAEEEVATKPLAVSEYGKVMNFHFSDGLALMGAKAKMEAIRGGKGAVEAGVECYQAVAMAMEVAEAKAESHVHIQRRWCFQRSIQVQSQSYLRFVRRQRNIATTLLLEQLPFYVLTYDDL